MKAATPSSGKLSPRGPQRRGRFGALAAVGAVFLALLAAAAAGEWIGWPFLAVPLQRVLSDTLERRVRFSVDAAGEAAAQASQPTSFGVRFLGGVRLTAPQIEIAAPAWSAAPHLLLARDVALELRYDDLWRAYRGRPLRIHRLQAATLDGHLERLADGRVSWQFGPSPIPAGVTPRPLPVPPFGHLRVAAGTLRYRDVPLAIDVEVRLSLPGGEPASVLRVNATGHYRHLPLKAELVSSGAMPWASDEAHAAPVPLTLHATVGRASLVLNGSAADALHLRGLTGRFSLAGPSLAAVGDPMGVTLPTTAAFRSVGVIVKQSRIWRVRIDDATVGASRLNGAFTYETGRSVPLLSGRLGGSRLWLADLGPVVGTTPALAAPTAEPSAASAAAPAPALLAASTRGKGKVLPNRPFDLAALRAMDANVLIDIREVDLNTTLLEPLRPLHGHLQLAGGMLTLRDIDARTAQGRLKGHLALDGRESIALLTADLRWDAVRLEDWIHQRRAAGAPPFVTGAMNGRAALSGQGRSTAEMLASLKGQVRTELHAGAVSHLAIEVAGLDVAQALGVLLKGDDMLPVQCAVADLVAQGGVLRPRVMVLDTTDSTVWIDGSLSLATEVIDLRAVVSPKDFSPLALRTPLRVRGTFAHPEVSLNLGKMGRKLAGSFLLALVHPLAALVPLVDPGDTDAASRDAAGCRGLIRRGTALRAAGP